MKFTVNTQELKTAMGIVSKNISAKSNLPILCNVMLQQRYTGDLILTGVTQENTLSVVCPMSDVEDWRDICVDAALLNSALSTLGNQHISVEVRASEAVITYATGHFSFAVYEADDFPEPPCLPADAEAILIPTDVLLSAVRTCKAFVANDKLRPVMNGICMDLTPDALTFAASDGHKLVRKSFPEVNTADHSGTLIISQPTAALLQLMPKGQYLTVTFTDTHAIFNTRGFELRARLVEGRFPNYNSVIPTDNPYRVEMSRSELMAALRRVSAIGNQSHGLIHLAVKRGLTGQVLAVQAENRDFSTSGYETVAAEFNMGNELHIGFNSTTLLGLLATHTTDRVRLALADPTRAGVMTDVDGDENLLTLAMPMMLND